MRSGRRECRQHAADRAKLGAEQDRLSHLDDIRAQERNWKQAREIKGYVERLGRALAAAGSPGDLVVQDTRSGRRWQVWPLMSFTRRHKEQTSAIDTVSYVTASAWTEELQVGTAAEGKIVVIYNRGRLQRTPRGAELSVDGNDVPLRKLLDAARATAKRLNVAVDDGRETARAKSVPRVPHLP